MRKEVLFAIIAGVLFGLVIAFGVWRANVAIKSNVEEISTANTHESEDKSLELQKEIGLTLATPENNDVAIETPIKISAITKPNAWVVISGEGEDYIIKASESGSFEQEVDLVAGVNQILITAFDEEGNSEKENLTLVYSTEFLKDIKDTDEE